ncbi:hypothetical protein Q9Q99_03860 [Curtobacterium flaccumfaciens]|nr:hypothetical protein Q9Q99_03860 [Curtobacterium flaccumfaciens]
MPDSRIRPRFCEPAHDLAVDAFVGGHPRGRVGVVGVGRTVLGALHEREDEDRPEPLGQRGEHPGPEAAPLRPADVVAEQVEPVVGVPPLGLGQRGQNLALLAGTARGEARYTAASARSSAR